MTSPFPLFPPSARVASPSPPGGAGVASTLRRRHDDSQESTLRIRPRARSRRRPECEQPGDAGGAATHPMRASATRVAVSPGRAPSAFRMVRGERPTSVPTRAADPSRTAAYLHCAQCPRYAAPPASCGESMRCRVSPRPSTEGPGHQSLRIAPRRPDRMSQRDARRGMRSVRRDRPTHANSSLCFGSRQTPYWGAHHPQLRGVSQGPMAYCSSNMSVTRPGRSLEGCAVRQRSSKR